MTPSIIRDWDATSKALEVSIAEAAKSLRDAADDPDHSEGDLRNGLRAAAQLTEHLGAGQMELMRFNRRNMIRFGWLSVMFFALAGLIIWERLP
jgi:hypothetical protein